MSSTAPFLSKLRKSDLVEYAEQTNLANYTGLKKSDLEVALDEHLRSNSTTYSKNPTFGEYYKRLETKGKSPVKKLAEKVSDLVKSDDDVPEPATVKKSRRKTKSPEDDATDTDGPIAALVKTPKEVGRRTSEFASSLHPPSPAVVADAIEHQTRRIRTSISHAYERSQVTEYTDSLRDTLSSSASITIFAIVVELYGLMAQIMPSKLLTEVPALPYLKDTPTPIRVSDLFALLSLDFWAPFTLWLLATIATPAIVSYFINFPLKQFPSHNYATRKASLKHEPHRQFDPFIFSLTKGLLGYLVFAQHLKLGLFAESTKILVRNAVPGGYRGLLTSTGIAAAVSLYEAVLKK